VTVSPINLHSLVELLLGDGLVAESFELVRSRHVKWIMSSNGRVSVNKRIAIELEPQDMFVV
jgi:hypothetical protein